MTFFVHKMTSRLARTLKIGTGKVFCTRNTKLTFKTAKNQLFLSYCTCLPKFGCGTTKPQKSMWHYWKMNFFSVCYSTEFELSLIQKWSLVFTPLAHNLTSKTGIFLKLSDGQNGNFNNHNQLIIQMICIASCIEEIYLKVLDKQSSWTYVRLIFERFVVISWLWFALDHLKCWEDRC